MKDRPSQSFWLGATVNRLGSNDGNEIVIQHDSIKATHVAFEIDEQGHCSVKNIEGNCKVNELPVITRKTLMVGDLLHIGSFLFELQEGRENNWSLVADSSWLQGKRFYIKEGKQVIGRSKEADIVLPGTHLSRRHAEIVLNKDGMMVTDLGSANGTFVNEKRITRSTVKDGDRLRFDIYTFTVDGPIKDGEQTQIRRHPPLTPVTDQNIMRGPRKPTSPGNRIEPEPPKESPWFNWITAAIFIGCMGFLSYLLYLFVGN
ncbi:FHA domain-containing protein [Marinibactrum halimedae]|nr:FHA domain-containing protein [Marinibactrum halimedae]MCD9458973.1 FHA domain-containing protein [Marinibactrum halimedae]